MEYGPSFVPAESVMGTPEILPRRARTEENLSRPRVGDLSAVDDERSVDGDVGEAARVVERIRVRRVDGDLREVERDDVAGRAFPQDSAIEKMRSRRGERGHLA